MLLDWKRIVVVVVCCGTDTSLLAVVQLLPVSLAVVVCPCLKIVVVVKIVPAKKEKQEAKPNKAMRTTPAMHNDKHSSC